MEILFLIITFLTHIVVFGYVLDDSNVEHLFTQLLAIFEINSRRKTGKIHKYMKIKQHRLNNQWVKEGIKGEKKRSRQVKMEG